MKWILIVILFTSCGSSFNYDDFGRKYRTETTCKSGTLIMKGNGQILYYDCDNEITDTVYIKE